MIPALAFPHLRVCVACGHVRSTPLLFYLLLLLLLHSLHLHAPNRCAYDRVPNE